MPWVCQLDSKNYERVLIKLRGGAEHAQGGIDFGGNLDPVVYSESYPDGGLRCLMAYNA